MTDRNSAAESVIFLHIPKTAGTTLNRLIEWEYPLFQMYSVDPVVFRWSAAHLRRLPERRLRRLRMFKGHMFFGLHEVLPQPATYITVLRDPVERVLSAFYFMRSYKLHPLYWKLRNENWTVEEFVRRSTRDNVQCKVIAAADYNRPCRPDALEKAKENLDRYFSVVGLSERFEESLALMKLRFGWKLRSYASFNVTRARPRKADIPEATRQLILEKNSFDASLYEYASQIFDQAVSERSAEVEHIARELKSAKSSQSSLQATWFSIQAAGRKAISRAYSFV